MGFTQAGMKLNDGGACVINDGKIYAVSEERVSRKKHDGGYEKSLPYCLQAPVLGYDDFSYVSR